MRLSLVLGEETEVQKRERVFHREVTWSINSQISSAQVLCVGKNRVMWASDGEVKSTRLYFSSWGIIRLYERLVGEAPSYVSSSFLFGSFCLIKLVIGGSTL